jgi:uncharacterized membrane protein
MGEEQAAFDGILVAAYPDEEMAGKVLESLKEAKEQKTFHYWDAAVIHKDAKGNYFANETKDMSTPKGAGIGALIGGIIGIPAGPAGIVLGAGLGTGIGAFFANSDGGIKDESLEEIGHSLQSGNSALFIVSDHEYLQSMRQYAAEESTTAAIKKLTTDIHAHMLHGENAAYLITAAGRSVSCQQLSADDEAAKLLGI